MAETTRIKVKNVQAGDPHLSFTLHPEDAGATLPSQVKATAAVSGIGSYSGSDTQTCGSTSDVNFTIQFTDPNYARETSLSYSISLQVPGPRAGTWVAYAGTVDDGSGSVTAVHTPDGGPDVVMADAEPVIAESGQAGSSEAQQGATTSNESATGNQGAKNKGCLAFLAMLPF